MADASQTENVVIALVIRGRWQPFGAEASAPRIVGPFADEAESDLWLTDNFPEPRTADVRKVRLTNPNLYAAELRAVDMLSGEVEFEQA